MKVQDHQFEVELFTGALDPDFVRVELYSDTARQEMKRVRQNVYTAGLAADQNPGDYTPRVVPSFPGAAVPLEASQILWGR